MSPSPAERRHADGLDEARRGLWRSAAESFAAAARADPTWPAPVLAEAVCRLRLQDAKGAVVLLETAPALRSVGEEPWRSRAAWLRAAARLACGDPQGAEQAAEGLPSPLWLRVAAHARLQGGDYTAGVSALLRAYRPGD